MTVMRRMMMRISEKIAEARGILSMTTGESLGQVASQTMESMNTINEVTNFPILRPLAAMDKLDIIDISKKSTRIPSRHCRMKTAVQFLYLRHQRLSPLEQMLIIMNQM